ncbi:MAG: VOC family protein [Bacteroidia bacterium]|nr:VOC family protein [Bacteroidia bacterium]MBT8267944.1 VOC family protein [Bacteroidia bacterium]NNK69409.1 VOC family protein [Flavobacteriaceae bacterium]NNL80789.1 VOC family protein [Flavobacteriaceae bacterium]
MQGLRTCCYVVSDLEEAKKWYTNAFETEPYFDEPFYVGFNIGGYELGLMPEEREYEVKTDNIKTYWGVDDISKAFNRLLKLGAKVEEEPFNVGGELMVATVRDPWNNLVGIIYNPYFELKS